MARRARAPPGAPALLLCALLLGSLPPASALASSSRLRAATASIVALQRSPIGLDGHGLPPDKHPLQRWELPWRGAAGGSGHVAAGWEADAVWSARPVATDLASPPNNASGSSSPSPVYSISVSETLLPRSNGLVTVTWSTPQPGYDDIVALYAPAGADARQVTPVKFAWAARSPGHLSSGRASMRLRVPNLRAPVAFALVRGGLGRPRTVAWSEPVRFARFDEPTQGHLVVTGREGEVKVLWVAGNRGGERDGEERGREDRLGEGKVPGAGTERRIGAERDESAGGGPRRFGTVRHAPPAERPAEPSAKPRRALLWHRFFGARREEIEAPAAPSRNAGRASRSETEASAYPAQGAGRADRAEAPGAEPSSGGAVQYGPAPPNVARLLSASSASSAPAFLAPRAPSSASSSAELPLSRSQLRSLLASVPLPLSSRAATLTYSAADLCGAPATGQGWIDPGVQHAATMRGLEGGRWYVYRYGDEAKGLWSEPQAYYSPPRAAEAGSEAVKNGGDGAGAIQDVAGDAAQATEDADGDATRTFAGSAATASDALKGSASAASGRALAPAPPPSVRILAIADLGQVELDGSFEASEMVASAATAKALRRELGLPLAALEEDEESEGAERGRGETQGAGTRRDGGVASTTSVPPLSSSAPPPSLLLLNGDVSYARGYGAIWDRFFEQFQDVFGRVPLATVPGNHERDWPGSGDRFPAVRDSGGECGLPYDVRLAMPMAGDDGGDLGWPEVLRNEIGIGPNAPRDGIEIANGSSSSSSARPDRPWYSLDHGPVHLVFYSTEHRFEAGSEQHAWILDDLRRVNRARTPWLVVNGHRPLYVDSTWDADRPDADQTMARALREAFEDAFQTFDVDLTLHGHHHSYQRTCPVKAGVCADGDGGEGARGGRANSREGPAARAAIVDKRRGVRNGNAEGGGAVAGGTAPIADTNTGTDTGTDTASTPTAASTPTTASTLTAASATSSPTNLPPVHLVIGHSGAGLTPNVHFFQPAIYRSVELRHGYVRIDANATHMAVETVASFSGQLLDRVVFLRD